MGVVPGANQDVHGSAVVAIMFNVPQVPGRRPAGQPLMTLSIAKEGFREIAVATLVLGALTALGLWFYWPAAIPFVALWIWVLSFFRDPPRQGRFQPGDLCAPADGRVTEVTELDMYDPIGAPAVRIGIFLSLFNVHANRAPCSGHVRSLSYRKGEYLDARHPQSGQRNESNTLLIDPDEPMPGPIEVRQIAGMAARRIICHARINQHLSIGARFGMIKFGSRTELLIPRLDSTQIKVQVGDSVRAGLTVVARQLITGPLDPGCTVRPQRLEPVSRHAGVGVVEEVNASATASDQAL